MKPALLLLALYLGACWSPPISAERNPGSIGANCDQSDQVCQLAAEQIDACCSGRMKLDDGGFWWAVSKPEGETCGDLDVSGHWFAKEDCEAISQGSCTELFEAGVCLGCVHGECSL